MVVLSWDVVASVFLGNGPRWGAENEARSGAPARF